MGRWGGQAVKSQRAELSLHTGGVGSHCRFQGSTGWLHGAWEGPPGGLRGMGQAGQILAGGQQQLPG